jgi:hypothetical protein
MVYLMTLPVTETIYHQMEWWLVHIELEKKWEEEVVALFEV